MPRYALTLEYDGTPYVGWQRQPGARSVQGALEAALFSFAQVEGEIVAAGRTDAGVHATAQVAHLDLPEPRDPFRIREGLNYYLHEESISVLACREVADDFHARFSATGRRYLYRILNRRSPLALEANRAWHVREPLDADAMRDAARVLIGRHDFTSFRAAACQSASPVKTLDVLDVIRMDEEIRFTVAARSFLHHQVRNLVGTLRLVGCGKWTTEDVQSALDARDRSAAGPTAPPEGLYLTDVTY